MNKIIEIRETLLRYVEDSKLFGFDPHDGLESPLIQKTFLKRSRFAKLVFLQLIKRLPINVRSLLCIKPHRNPKAIGLLLSSWCQLGLVDEKKEQIDEYIQILEETKSPFFDEYCWGYPFDWQARAFFQEKNYPTVVASSFVGQALLDIYERTENKKCLNMAISIADFFRNHLNRTKLGDSFSFSYSPADQSVVFNATALGARHLARVYNYTKNEEFKRLASDAIEPLISYQASDGSWAYGLQKHHSWIDNFHTGYNLECLYETQKFLEHNRYDHAIERGLKYYVETLFEKDGTAKYYSTNRYPIDSHAPAQFLVTIHKLSKEEQYKEFVNLLLSKWIESLYSPKNGLFYYQQSKYFTNKINYLRWTQSWALYGLSFLGYDEKNNIS